MNVLQYCIPSIKWWTWRVGHYHCYPQPSLGAMQIVLVLCHTVITLWMWCCSNHAHHSVRCCSYHAHQSVMDWMSYPCCCSVISLYTSVQLISNIAIEASPTWTLHTLCIFSKLRNLALWSRIKGISGIESLLSPTTILLSEHAAGMIFYSKWSLLETAQ